jgi:hypothetical protein
MNDICRQSSITLPLITAYTLCVQTLRICKELTKSLTGVQEYVHCESKRDLYAFAHILDKYSPIFKILSQMH